MTRKANLFAGFLLSLTLAAFMVHSVYAPSIGFERYQDSDCEVQISYFPIVPVDTRYPTASEQFPIKFYIYQRNWWNVIYHYVPHRIKIWVYYRDDTCGVSDYPTWYIWRPTSVSQRGLSISWTLTAAFGSLSISGTIKVPDIASESRNYQKYDATGPDGKQYKHMSDLAIDFSENPYWGDATTEGEGVLSIPNNVGGGHMGHHILMWIKIDVVWYIWAIVGWFFGAPIWLPCGEGGKTRNFIIGDDVPSDTDCWLTISPGNT